jgi:hypothetical protein
MLVSICLRAFVAMNYLKKEQPMKKRQQISQYGVDLCSTIPQRAIEAFDISTKRFFEWEKTSTEVIGMLCPSETVVTTRVRLSNNNRYLVEILPAYSKQFGLTPTKKGGPMAIFEWDDTTLQVRIPLKNKN